MLPAHPLANLPNCDRAMESKHLDNFAAAEVFCHYTGSLWDAAMPASSHLHPRDCFGALHGIGPCQSKRLCLLHGSDASSDKGHSRTLPFYREISSCCACVSAGLLAASCFQHRAAKRRWCCGRALQGCCLFRLQPGRSSNPALCWQDHVALVLCRPSSVLGQSWVCLQTISQTYAQTSEVPNVTQCGDGISPNKKAEVHILMVKFWS